MLAQYQIEGMYFLAARKYALLADVMGLGKTPQAIKAADLVGAKQILVLCPAIGRYHWQREFEKWSAHSPDVRLILSTKDEPGPQVTVCNYELLVRKPIYTKLLEREWGLVILDESHYLNGRKAKRTKLVYQDLCDKSRRMWALSGTPTRTNYAELWPMLRAWGIYPKDYWSFVKRFCTGYDNGFGHVITGGKNIASLKSLVEPITLRRKKEQVMAQLPPIRFSELTVEPSEVDLDEWMYRKDPRQERLVKQIAEQEAIASLALRNAAPGDQAAPLGPVAKSLSTYRQYTALQKVPKLAELINYELEHGLDKIVIFAHHRVAIECMRQYLRSHKPAVLYGGTPPQKRELRIKQFQSQPEKRVFLAQIQAAGTTIDLTAACEALFIEMSYVPADNAQAAMRVHRRGQTRRVTVRVATLPNSVDQRVMNVLRRRTATITRLWD